MKQRVLGYGLLGLMVFQSAISLLIPLYLDQGWIKETWLGNDAVTLLVASPLFLFSLASRKALARIIYRGCLGFIIYNYSFYLLGAEINRLFLVYAALVSLGIVAMIKAISEEGGTASGYFERGENYLFPALVFLFIGGGLGSVWIGAWIGHAFFGANLPIESSAFRLVAALDLVLIVNMMMISGILLIRRKALGFVTGSIVGIQGFLYLLVLTVNSLLLSRGQGALSGELPIWGSLLIVDFVGLASLLAIGMKRAPSLP